MSVVNNCNFCSLLTCLDLGTVTGMSLTNPLVAVMYKPLEKGSIPLDPFEGKKCFLVMDL